MWLCTAFLGFLMQLLNSITVFLLGFLSVIIGENSWCKLIWKIQGPELNGLPCVNKVLLYFTLLYFYHPWFNCCSWNFKSLDL